MSDYLTADGILVARSHGWPALLKELAKPVNPALIQKKPGRGNPEYIAHHTLRQYLHVAFDYTTIRTIEVVDKGDGKYGLKCELTCALGDDVRTFHGWGESDNTDYPLKSAESDAFRRICGMDLGLGLALWARESFFLDSAYEASSSTEGEGDPVPVPRAKESTSGSPTSSPAESVPHGDGEPEPSPTPGSPTTSSGADGEAAPEEDTFRLDKAERAKIRSGFMARTQTDLGLSYDQQIKPWIAATYKVSGWSELTDAQAHSLYTALTSGTREEKEAAGKRFKKAVLDHTNKEKAA